MRLCLIVKTGWQNEPSGVGTFLRTVIPQWETSYRMDLLEFGSCGGGAREQKAEPPVSTPRRKIALPSFLSLGLGYSRAFRRDMKWLLESTPSERPELVVVNEYGCETMPVAAAKIFSGVPIVALAHTHPGESPKALHPIRRFVEKLCARSVSAAVFHSNSNRDAWLKRGSPVSTNVIPHGLDVPEGFDAEGADSRCQGVHFVVVSRLVAWKGHKVLLEAWKLAQPDLPVGSRLTVVGDGPMRGSIEDWLIAHDPGNAISLKGAIPNGATSFCYADCAIHVPTEPEAFGLVVLEAIARGVPVIASEIGGIPEIISDGDEGLLVPAGDVPALAAAMIRISKDAPMRRSMGLKARQTFCGRFSTNRMLDQYDQFFRSLT